MHFSHGPLTTRIHLVASVLLCVLSACGDETPPTGVAPPSSPVDRAAALERAADAAAHPGEVVQRVLATILPGFAGLWYDQATGELQISALATTSTTAENRLLKAHVFAAFPELRERNMRSQVARYTYNSLAAWRWRLREVFKDPRVHGLDLDERRNQLSILVTEEEARQNVQRIAHGMGIPAGAVRVEVGPPTFPQILLTDYNRPTIENGFRIAFPDVDGTFLCTHGADVRAPGPTKGFITNSHCSEEREVGKGLDKTLFYQDVPAFNKIVASETIDPPLFTGGSCPSGKRCRYSDALFADYQNDKFYGNKLIAESTIIGSGMTAGSLTVASYRTAAQTSNVLQGFVVRKTGQSTGTTQGAVQSTCTDVIYGNPNTSTIVLLCQDKVNAPSRNGDSGSPVYYSSSYSTPTSSVFHVGILWGGNCPLSNPDCLATQFTMSPWSGITTDLGIFYTF